jgi:ADP-ribose pyrophosphatase
MKPWKRIEPTTVTKVGWRTVVTKTFIDNSGNQHIFDTLGAESSACAAVVALTLDNQAIIVRQFRTGPEQIMDELPGGDSVGENPTVAAERELLEEAGYQAENMESLGSYIRDAYTNEVSHVFFATGCTKISEQKLDHEEEIEVQLISIPQLLHNAKHGKMTDAVAVLMAYDQLTKIQENA